MKELIVRSLVQSGIVLTLLLSSLSAALAQDQLPIPEPFCGNLADADCDLLRQSSDAMLNLESYAASVVYRLAAQGLPDMPPDESFAELRIDSRYALDDGARQSMRFFAVQSRQEPLAAVSAIGESPELLINLYKGMTAELNFTLEFSPDWAEGLSDTTVTWPQTVHAAARLIDGVLYIDIHELKGLDADLANVSDWVGVELVKTLENLAEQGAFADLAANVADSSLGRPVWGLDPAMLNLITSMRAAFGRPQALEPFMDIRRSRDVDLDAQAGAVYSITFNALDFILSDAFRDLLLQTVEVGVASSGEEINRAELEQYVDLFWLFAPAIFRDLEISGSYTVGQEDRYQYASQTLIHWDLLTLIRSVSQISGEELSDMADKVYIDLSVASENSGFNEALSLVAPAGAQMIPSEVLANLETLGFQQIIAGEGEAEQGEATGSDSNAGEEGEQHAAQQKDGSSSNAASKIKSGVKTSNISSFDTPTSKGSNETPTPTEAGEEANVDLACASVLQKASSDFKQQAYESALGQLTAAADDCTESADAAQLLGAAYYKRYEQTYFGGNADQADPDDVYRAITQLSRAIELKHEHLLAHYYRGLAFESLGQYGHAVDDLSYATELTPDDPYAYFPLARIYAELGETQQAISHYQTFLDLYEPDDEWRALAEDALAELK
jgi:hypothetical protein